MLRDVKFGKNLESIGAGAFLDCPSLERITIPTLNGLIGNNRVFTGCEKLMRINLFEDVIIHRVVDTLLMKEWRQDTRNVIGSINQILPNTPAGRPHDIIYGEVVHNDVVAFLELPSNAFDGEDADSLAKG